MQVVPWAAVPVVTALPVTSQVRVLLMMPMVRVLWWW